MMSKGEISEKIIDMAVQLVDSHKVLHEIREIVSLLLHRISGRAEDEGAKPPAETDAPVEQSQKGEYVLDGGIVAGGVAPVLEGGGPAKEDPYVAI